MVLLCFVGVLVSCLSLIGATIAGVDINVLADYLNDLSGVTTLLTRQGVTLTSCERWCKASGRCNSVTYNRRAAYCVLSSSLVEQDEKKTVYSDGMVRRNVKLQGTDSEIRVTHDSCDGMTCPQQDTCTQTDAGEVICKTTECSASPHASENVKGNLNAVGNKMVVNSNQQLGSGGQQFVTWTCEEDGNWMSGVSYVTRDCSDVTGDSGVYMMSQQQLVYCDMRTENGHWLVFQRRQDGSVDFFRDWTEYKNGFGQLTGEFWLGLELLHQLLRQGSYELRVDLEDFLGDTRFAKYSTFTVGGETEKYQLGVAGFTGDAGDSMGWHDGMFFSTYDQENDVSDRDNCALKFTGAWWYNTCHKSNLNGEYFHGAQNTTVYAKHVHWFAWHGYFHSLKTTEMKIRRHNT